MGAALLMVALPVEIAGLLAPSAMVKVGPPLSCRGPRIGSPEMSPEPVEIEELLVIEPSSTRLLELVPIVLLLPT